MRETINLLRHERRARIFFLTLTQSSLGTGAAYIGLLLIAYERFESPWAVSLLLVVDLIPAMLAGPVFGAAADRWSRKRCLIVSDVVRVLAFAGIAVVDSFAATLAFAFLTGVGTGLSTPAALAALPSVVDDSKRVPAATSLYSAIADLGFTIGPAIAAPLLLLGGPEAIMIVNAITFALSAVLLSRVRFGAAADREAGPRPTLFGEAREGLRETMRVRGVRLVVLGTGAAFFCGGLLNVAELFFATDELGVGNAAFAVLVSLFGLGFIAGSLTGSSGGDPARLRKRYLLGLLAFGVGLLTSGLAPTYAVALFTFGLAGLGNGAFLVYQRLLIQDGLPESLHGRAFGVNDALGAWAFAIAFVAAGGLLSTFDPGTVMVIAGALGLMVCALSALTLRVDRSGPSPTVSEVGSGGGAGVRLDDGVLGQHGAHAVDGGGPPGVRGVEAADDVA